MIKQLMILDGVMAVAQFRDDGVLVEGLGMQDENQLAGLAMFAHELLVDWAGSGDRCEESRTRPFAYAQGDINAATTQSTNHTPSVATTRPQLHWQPRSAWSAC